MAHPSCDGVTKREIARELAASVIQEQVIVARELAYEQIQIAVAVNIARRG